MENVVVNVCSSDLFKSKRAASCLSKRATRFCSNMFILFVTSHDCAVSQLFLLLCRSAWVRAKIHRVLLLSFFPCVLKSCASAAAGLDCSFSWLSSSKIFRFANAVEIYVLSETCLDHCLGLPLKSVNMWSDSCYHAVGTWLMGLWLMKMPIQKYGWLWGDY